ncbi:MAG: hypothetical protein Q8910_00820 [Bacteroidota bacterium]|nr:hypothetical protein [Bacteroidota bacterium]
MSLQDDAIEHNILDMAKGYAKSVEQDKQEYDDVSDIANDIFKYGAFGKPLGGNKSSSRKQNKSGITLPPVKMHNRTVHSTIPDVAKYMLPKQRPTRRYSI